MALLAAWLALADSSGKWLPSAADTVGLHPDSWSYQAFSDYLDHYSRGRSDGMPMVDEFGSHLQGTRFATPALLALLHDQPVLADVPTTRLTFSLLCLVVHFFSMTALGRACVNGSDWLLPLCAAFLSTAEGWLGRILMAANNDNLIFVALAPALLALCCAAGDGGRAVRWRMTAALALLFGAILYTYPEGMALLGGQIVSRRAHAGRRLELVGGGLAGVALASPYLPTFGAFVRSQMNMGTTITLAQRPGEGFLPGLLLGPNRLAASFALGDEILPASTRLATNLLPLCLLALVIAGAWFLSRRQRWFAWVALPLIGLYLWQNVAKHYDYGTFKVLVMSGWWVALAISAGVFWIAERLSLSTAGKIVLAALLLSLVGVTKSVNRLRLPPVALAEQIKSLQELSSLHFVTGQAPVLLAVDGEFDYLWATYYLRGLPLGTWQQRGYLAMPHVTPYLLRGVLPPPETCPFQLVSGARSGALWQNARFSLVRTTPLFLANLQNPANGLEMIDGQRFLWVGTQPATFHVVSRTAGHYLLSALRINFGPSMAGRMAAHVAVQDADGTHEVEVAAGASAIPIALAAGDTAVALRCLDVPEPGPHNGDPRELMLGFLGPGVASPEDIR